jgi:SAM-dependent methyltransferase
MIPATLVLGCGTKPHRIALNVDARALPGVDRVMDLNAVPWDLPSAHFRTVIAEHVLEHAKDRLAFLNECHRVARPGGWMIVEVPHFKHHYAHGMLDHRWTFAHNSFDAQYNLDGKWRKVRVDYRIGTRGLWLRWERLGRVLAKYTGLVSGFRFYLQRGNDGNQP